MGYATYRYLNDRPNVYMLGVLLNVFWIAAWIRRLLVATTRPVSIEDNVIFVIDTSKLPCPSDVRADDLGSWRCNGKQLCYCTLSPTGQVEEIQTRKPSNSKSTYGLIRRYYTHGTVAGHIGTKEACSLIFTKNGKLCNTDYSTNFFRFQIPVSRFQF